MKLSDGFITKKIREEYLDYKKIKRTHEVTTLNGLENDTDTLYFWQLYSIIGEDMIVDIITRFYTDVLTDNEDVLFRDTFKESGDLEHHVKKQTSFWIDVTGGGKRYPGGEARLELHHDNAKIIMNQNGANRWLYHMKNSIKETHIGDTRVIPCIVEFVNFFMLKYGKTYNFRARL